MIRIALRALLAERGMTQLELAQKAGIRPSTICDMCNNNAERIKLAHLERICEVLEVQVSDVIKKQA